MPRPCKLDDRASLLSGSHYNVVKRFTLEDRASLVKLPVMKVITREDSPSPHPQAPQKLSPQRQDAARPKPSTTPIGRPGRARLCNCGRLIFLQNRPNEPHTSPRVLMSSTRQSLQSRSRCGRKVQRKCVRQLGGGILTLFAKRSPTSSRFMVCMSAGLDLLSCVFIFEINAGECYVDSEPATFMKEEQASL